MQPIAIGRAENLKYAPFGNLAMTLAFVLGPSQSLGEPGKNEKRRPYAFTKTWGLLKKKLGMPDLRFHDLRHEAVSRLVEGGLFDQDVSAISGHKSMPMLKRSARRGFCRQAGQAEAPTQGALTVR